MTYDAEGRLTFRYFSIDYDAISGIPSLIGQSSTYEYGENGLISKETHDPGSSEQEIVYIYDNLNRIERVERVCGPYPTFNYVTEYSYNQGDYYGYGENSSYLVDTYTSTVGSSTKNYYYEYDSRNNISSITDSGVETTYTYDDLGQLTKEETSKVTKNYIYDDAGNITTIKRTTYSSVSGEIMSYALIIPPLRPITTTIALSYTDSEWGDLLTSYDGHTITYDEIGNPLSYYNGSAYTFTWEGRRLVGAVNGSNTMSFTYDDNGIRTSKTVNGVKHTYHLNGSQIVAEEWGNKLIIYLYDASGSPIGMMYRTTSYAAHIFDVFWFEKNLQGDIVAVYDESGTKVVSYGYTNAWGIHNESYSNGGDTSGAQYNPFRYRGYYYDADLGMYYLQSRYYDPNTCRFINADGYVSTGQGLTGYNMFAYCGNDPVNRIDPMGMWTITISVSVDFTFFFVGISEAFSISLDDDWNVVLQHSYSEPNYVNDNQTFHIGLSDMGMAVGLQTTNDDTVYDLEGNASYVGFSAGSGPFVGFDFVSSGHNPTKEGSKDNISGWQVCIGYGIGVDVHYKTTYTTTVFDFKTMRWD